MIDVVIINWNSGSLLRACTQSLLSNDQKNLIRKIIIVDNFSNDHSQHQIPNDHRIILIQNNENLGFSKACNQGFLNAEADYVLLLNPDAEVLDNTLEAALECMNMHSNVDILGVQLLDERNGKVQSSCARFPKPSRFLFHSLGLSKLLPGVFHPPTLMTDWNHQESRYVDQVMGAFMFIRRTTFERIGYFDERFFVYYEELDFSLRLKKSGGKTYFNANIQALHKGGGTTASVVDFRLYLSLQSRLRYAKKNFSKLGYWMVLFSTCFIEPWMRLCLLIIQRNFKEISDLFKGYNRLVHAWFQNSK
jgi:N-acetylglucosaminyl-diphospho-decaprenol L-rhamnosyltransferase